MTEALTKLENEKPRLADDPASLVAGMMEAVIKKGITQENVAAVKELALLFKDMHKLRAEQDFAKAFAELQKEVPAIRAKNAVPNNDGSVRYRFAPYEDIMEQVRPLATHHGFTISFSQRFDGPRVFITCTLQHTGGHSRSNEFGVRIGSGPPKSSEAQGDGAAATYAKRFALCNALNIIIESDTDAASEGPAISGEKAAEFLNRMGNLGWSDSYVARFLKWLNAPSVEKIQTTRLADAEDCIAKAEKKAVDKLRQ